MEVIKQRMQLQLAGYSTLAQSIASTPRNHLLRGFWVSLAAFAPYTVLYFTIRERLLDYARDREEWRVRIASSMGAATAAAIVTTPLDVVRIRTQAYMASHTSARSTLMRVVRTEGVGALWRGTWARGVWACANTGAVVALYELCTKYV